MIGIILAAGKGSRLSKGTDNSISKPLIKVGEKELIEYSLENNYLCNIKSAVIVVNNENGEIPAQVGTRYKDIKIEYAIQSEPRGLMNAVMSAVDSVDDDILVQLSDEIFINAVIEDCIDYFYSSNADFVVTYTHEKSQERIQSNFSVDIDDNGNVLKCIEKSPIIINDLKGTGFCIFNRECLYLLKKYYNNDTNYPNELCDYINLLIEHNKCGKSFCIADQEININTAEELDYAQRCVNEESK